MANVYTPGLSVKINSAEDFTDNNIYYIEEDSGQAAGSHHVLVMPQNRIALVPSDDLSIREGDPKMRSGELTFR